MAAPLGWLKVLAWASSLAWAGKVFAAAPCDASDGSPRPDAWVLRVANDIVAQQDQNLTSGLQFKWVQAAGPEAIACSVGALRWAEQQLARLGPANPEQVDTSVAVTQLLFTPQDATRRDVIREDRPYAGVALATLGYSARRGDTLWATDLSIGWVGPAALGRETQNLAHKVFDSTKFEGWSHQLADEPLFMLAHDRTWRREPRRIGALEFDSFTHAGATLGNFLTRGELGFEWRLGQSLPDDFGSDPLRLTSTRTAARTGVGPLAGWGWHVFISGNGRGVLHDITLAGNTFRDSQRVDRRFWVASAAVGFALRHGRWTFAFARGAQTRDFDNQIERPALGSFTLTTTLD